MPSESLGALSAYQHNIAQGEALAGLVYLKLLPLTELASLIDARLCRPWDTEEENKHLAVFTTCALHAYLRSGG